MVGEARDKEAGVQPARKLSSHEEGEDWKGEEREEEVRGTYSSGSRSTGHHWRHDPKAIPYTFGLSCAPCCK